MFDTQHNKKKIKLLRKTAVTLLSSNETHHVGCQIKLACFGILALSYQLWPPSHLFLSFVESGCNMS